MCLAQGYRPRCAALDPARERSGEPVRAAHLGLSESPRYIGRGIAVAAPIGPWNQCSVTSGQLARDYGFIDLDGS